MIAAKFHMVGSWAMVSDQGSWVLSALRGGVRRPYYSLTLALIRVGPCISGV